MLSARCAHLRASTTAASSSTSRAPTAWAATTCNQPHSCSYSISRGLRGCQLVHSLSKGHIPCDLAHEPRHVLGPTLRLCLGA